MICLGVHLQTDAYIVPGRPEAHRMLCFTWKAHEPPVWSTKDKAEHEPQARQCEAWFGLICHNTAFLGRSDRSLLAPEAHSCQHCHDSSLKVQLRHVRHKSTSLAPTCAISSCLLSSFADKHHLNDICTRLSRWHEALLCHALMSGCNLSLMT